MKHSNNNIILRFLRKGTEDNQRARGVDIFGLAGDRSGNTFIKDLQ